MGERDQYLVVPEPHKSVEIFLCYMSPLLISGSNRYTETRRILGFTGLLGDCNCLSSGRWDRSVVVVFLCLHQISGSLWCPGKVTDDEWLHFHKLVFFPQDICCCSSSLIKPPTFQNSYKKVFIAFSSFSLLWSTLFSFLCPLLCASSCYFHFHLSDASFSETLFRLP